MHCGNECPMDAAVARVRRRAGTTWIAMRVRCNLVAYGLVDDRRLARRFAAHEQGPRAKGAGAVSKLKQGESGAGG